MELLLEHLGKGFMDMLLISMPVVLTAAGIGLVVGILQAVTQVQEQTIAAAPKILGVFIVIVALGGFFTKILTEYMTDSINLALRVVPKQGEFILPPSDMYSPNNTKDYSSLKQPDIKEIMKSSNKLSDSLKKPKSVSIGADRTPIAQPNIVESKKLQSGR